MHIAIIGCGQLSRMLALAGIPLGFRFSFIADTPDTDARPVERLGTVIGWERERSAASLYARLGRPDVVTAEKEQVDTSLLELLSRYCAVHPNPAAFATFQDRRREKALLSRLRIPSSPHVHATSAAEAADKLTLPLVAKSCREGYDGKNQHILRTRQDVIAFDATARDGDFIIEQWVPFERELSIISARDTAGNISHYPITENVHENGILKHSVAPAENVSETLSLIAGDYITRVMHDTQYVGVMAMECFVVNGRLLVNEIAPRVHNSGHWTQSGCKTSQFENHLRAIAGLPLGSTDYHGVSGMVNLIGRRVPTEAAFSTHSTMHWYDKAERPGRKLGHVNFHGASHEELKQKMSQFRREALEPRTGS